MYLWLSCRVWYIINVTKIHNFRVSHLLFLLHVEAIAIMPTYSLLRVSGHIEFEINILNISCELFQDDLRTKLLQGNFETKIYIRHLYNSYKNE